MTNSFQYLIDRCVTCVWFGLVCQLCHAIDLFSQRAIVFESSKITFSRFKIFFPGVTKYGNLFTWRYSFLGSAFGLNELLDNEFNFKLCVFTSSFFFAHCIVFVRLINENFLPFQYFTSPPANFNTTVWSHLPQ